MTSVLTDAVVNALLDSAVAAGLTTTPFMSLHTAFPPTTGNEVTGGSPAYARLSFTWNAAGTPTARQKQSSASKTFDVPAGTVRAVATYDAVTAGTQKAWGPANASARRGINVSDAADVTANTIDSPAHGLAAGDHVLFWATIGAALPAGLAEDTEYFVIAAGLTTDVFSVSTTLGGSAVDITGNGDGDVQKFIPEVFAAQGTYTVPAFVVGLSI